MSSDIKMKKNERKVYIINNNKNIKTVDFLY